MRDGKFYWDLKIEETKALFAKRPGWMGNYDNDYPSAAFIKGLISDYKPENMLEIGAAAGWASYYMLDEALKHNKRANLTSVDFADTLYYDSTKKVGCVFDEVKEASVYKKYWDLQNNTLMIDYAQNCRKRFDFVFIDANHLHPWAALDFLACLPFLKKGAVVVFHDVNLNEICAGNMSAERHPDCVYKGVNMCKGPNILYKIFNKEMTLSYDDVAPNCAAMQVKDIEGALLKIYYALQVKWERGSYDESLLAVISRYLDFVREHVNEDCARQFSQVMLENYNEIEVTDTSIKKDKIRIINSLTKNKKTVFWGASIFLEKALKLKLVETESVLGIIDIDDSKAGKKLGGLPVFLPEAIDTLKPELIVSTVVNIDNMQDKIIETLREKNIKTPCAIEADF